MIYFLIHLAIVAVTCVAVYRAISSTMPDAETAAAGMFTALAIAMVQVALFISDAWYWHLAGYMLLLFSIAAAMANMSTRPAPHA